MDNEHTPDEILQGRPWVSPWRIHRLEGDLEIFWYDGEEGVDSYTYVARHERPRETDDARRHGEEGGPA